MKAATGFAPLLERFFTQRLMQQRQVSPHTISSYRDTFRLLLRFAHARLHQAPSHLQLEDIDAPLIVAFLEDLQKRRDICARTRNLRLTAIHSFFRYVAFEEPGYSFQVQRVLAIPPRRFTRTLVGFLTPQEVDAVLAAPDQRTWGGRRDRAFILFAVQTGLRSSEMTGLKREDLVLAAGAHVGVIGKGRKERSTPLARATVAVLRSWLQEPARGDGQIVFPNARGGRLSADGVRYLLARHCASASRVCPSLRQKRVTPHVLRHTTAMDLLAQGVDRSLIALWLGHESVETTQVYLDATLALKEAALARVTPHAAPLTRYRASDQLLRFLSNL